MFSHKNVHENHIIILINKLEWQNLVIQFFFYFVCEQCVMAIKFIRVLKLDVKNNIQYDSELTPIITSDEKTSFFLNLLEQNNFL